MQKDTVHVSVGGKEIWLVGTAHVSQKSVDSVKEVIEEVNPDAVAVELCDQRFTALMEGKKWEERDIIDVYKGGRGALFLVQIVMANFQRRIGEQVGVKPGSEMLGAIQAAKECKIPLILADRDLRVTLKRASSAMSLWEKGKIVFGLIEGVAEGEEIDTELVEKLKEGDALTELMDELSREAPSVKRVLVDERDQYIAAKLLESPYKRIVTVIGAGHSKGIVKNLREMSFGEADRQRLIKTLDKTESKRSMLKYVGYSIPFLVFFILGWMFLNRGFEASAHAFGVWFIIHGVLAALGAALALAHPLTILTAFLVAPFTSLRLAAVPSGWIAGAVEMKLRKPRVKDFTGLMKLNSYRDYVENRVTRLFLVVVFINIGSTAATFISLWYMVRAV
ncbi:TraB family protein [uncultured archaeon]|nr:TraB family protein [uncultured archaeon]